MCGASRAASLFEPAVNGVVQLVVKSRLLYNLAKCKMKCNIFVELGGGVGDVCVWRRDGECIEVSFR